MRGCNHEDAVLVDPIDHLNGKASETAAAIGLLAESPGFGSLSDPNQGVVEVFPEALGKVAAAYG